MIHPSYQELIATINEGQDLDEAPVVSSRYSLVLATSKRARQIIGGDEPLIARAAGKKPLSIAVQELYEGKVKILGDNDAEEAEEAKAIEAAADGDHRAAVRLRRIPRAENAARVYQAPVRLHPAERDGRRYHAGVRRRHRRGIRPTDAYGAEASDALTRVCRRDGGRRA